ncbi:MAG: hypothetical protein ABIS15_02715 [Gemmatimonadaceae bacterium]
MFGAATSTPTASRAAWNRILFSLLLSIVPVLASCRAEESAAKSDGADVPVVVRSGTIEAPDSVDPGWRRLRVQEDGAGHIVVLFRLAGDRSDANVTAFLAELDTASATPRNAVAMGGPEVGDSVDVIVRLEPGFYVIGCVRRGKDNHRHASAGEMKVIAVRDMEPDAAHSTPPAATAEVRLVDFAFVGPDKWPAGSQMLRVDNTGAQDHQLRLVRLRDGSSMKEWLEA